MSQIKVIRKTDNAVVLHVHGTQSGVLSDPKFMEFINTQYNQGVHRIELYQSHRDRWSECNVMYHRDKTYRGLRLKASLGSDQHRSIQEQARGMRELDKCPPVGEDQAVQELNKHLNPAEQEAFNNMKDWHRQIKEVLNKWDNGPACRYPDTADKAINLLRNLQYRIIC